MTTIAVMMLLAALLPLLVSLMSKVGGQDFDNATPRAWLSRQQGWRARANAAQSNMFESLPFFFAAVLYAVWHQAELVHLGGLMAAWLLLRVIYVGLYVGGRATARSLVWAAAFAVNVAILFAG